MQKKLSFVLLAMAVAACGAESPAETKGGSDQTHRTHQLSTTSVYALPGTWNSEHVQPGVVDDCYLSVASDRLFAGTVTEVEGPILPQDPCDAKSYRFVRPHYEVTIEEESGTKLEMVWLDKDAKPTDLDVGDVILGGIRTLDGQHFLQRFAIRNPTRAHHAVQASFSDVVPVLQPTCATKDLKNAEFRAAVHADPDVSCGVSSEIPYRAKGEIDDEVMP